MNQDQPNERFIHRKQISLSQSVVVNIAPYECEQRRQYSEINFKDMEEINKCYVLVNIINMKMDVRQASQILQNLDLGTDKHVLLSQVTNQMLQDDRPNPNPLLTSFRGTKNLLLSRLQKFGYYIGSNNQQREVAAMPRERCSVCFDEKPPQDFVTMPHCQERFCRICVGEYLRSKIENGDVLHISCLSDNCLTILNDQFIRNHIDNELIQKYVRFVKIKTLMRDPNLRWCPSDCGRYVKGSEGDKKIVCDCGTEICFKCGNVYHGDVSCLEHLDHAYVQATQVFQIHNCPNCKRPIQKNDGCNHMTCAICGHQFCWLCKGVYTSNHFNQNNFLNGCPGMQNVQIEPYRYPRLRHGCRLAFIVLIFPLLFSLFILGGVILTVLSGLTGPMILYMQCVTPAEFKRYSCCRRTCVIMMWFLLGVLCYPMTMTVYLLMLTGIIIYGLGLVGYECVKCIKQMTR